jgi:hypothetical protein
MKNRQIYQIEVVHPTTGFHTGTHVVTVATETRTRYVTGLGFGCSRDYLADTDEQAIKEFLAEHGCKVTNIQLQKE